MIKSITQKEFFSFVRDRKNFIFGLVLLGLLIVSLLYGVKIYQSANNLVAEYQDKVNQEWISQPDRHPHRVAHYGHFAFKPLPILSFFDIGTNFYTGNSIYLEAHRQNSVNFGYSQLSPLSLRLGELTPALILQMLLPLFIIFIGFNSFTSERENGTLKLLLSQGASYKKIFYGKVFGTLKMLGLWLIPLFLMGFTFVLLNKETDSIIHFLLLSLFYFLYILILVVITVMTSSFFQKSNTALITLLAFWIGACVLIPKIASNWGTYLFPTPIKAQMDFDIHKEVSKGVDGHNSKNQRAEELKAALLKKYNVSRIEDLPLNFDGIIMAEGEAHSSEVYQKHLKNLNQTFENQNSIFLGLSFINPYLAIKNISMGLSGTDVFHYIDFQDQVEDYRFKMVQWLNDLQAKKLNYGDWQYKLPKETWKEMKEFVYSKPSIASILFYHKYSIISLLFWSLALIYIAPLLSQKKEELS